MWNRSLNRSAAKRAVINQSINRSVNINKLSVKFSHSASDKPAQLPQGMLTLEELKQKTINKSINQVVLGFPDMYGRMLGKRFDASFFLESIGQSVKSLVNQSKDPSINQSVNASDSSKSKSGTSDSSVKQSINHKLNETPEQANRETVKSANHSTNPPQIATGACDYLLGCDMEMQPIKNLKFANWERGFGDFHLAPDWSSARVQAWSVLQSDDQSINQSKQNSNNQSSMQSNIQSVNQSINPSQESPVALIMTDLYNDDHELIKVAPRTILRKQIESANEILNNQSPDQSTKTNYEILAASELEYYTFEQSYRESNAQKYSDLTPVSHYFEDYHLLQTSREEFLSSKFRQYLIASGIEVESSKGECGLGQHELNIKYASILSMADRHTVYKQCLKEVADAYGRSVTFMAKPYTDSTGSGCHLHLSIINQSNGENAFKGPIKLNDKIHCSQLFLHFLAGWLKYLPETMPFYAPTVNSYKRFVSSSWAPTSLTWSYDNRTAGFRVVGKGQSLRIECRIPGADVNIYLAFAAALASGMKGVQEKLEPPPMYTGNSYDSSTNQSINQLPKSLGEAVNVFEKSQFARQVFGDDVVEHYATFYRNEQTSFDRHVADWERTRYFERI